MRREKENTEKRLDSQAKDRENLKKECFRFWYLIMDNICI